MKSPDSIHSVLADALQELENETVEQLEERASLRANCLSVPRGSDLAFAPSQATLQERSHFGQCARCQRMLARLGAEEHPQLSVLYASRWSQLPPTDQSAIDAHMARCQRCRLLTTVTDVLPGRWLESIHHRLVGAVHFAVTQPAPIGLNRTNSARYGFREVVTSGDWVVIIEEHDSDIHVVVNRKADGAHHPLAYVVLIGPDHPVSFSVTLTQTGDWWTGSMQVVNPWAELVESVAVSAVVAEV